uniref:Mitochondrial import inner membrane translocase subunit n=1 Tax=Maylandia zebra TaxID=106582 RepID=A0A3P9DRQ1_9CICH
MAVQVSEFDQIKQFKEFLGTYNKVTENCFMDCVRDFTTRDVKPEEEYHIQQNEALAAKAGLLGQPR